MSDATALSKVLLRIEGASFALWTSVSIERDMEQMCGGFSLEYVDLARGDQALPARIYVPPFFKIIRRGMRFQLEIDGEVDMIGWISDVELDWEADRISARIHGRDLVGDLVDCAALPNGPPEFKGVDLTYVANTVCAPFGIKVIAEVDVGDPFERLAAYPHQTAHAFLESAARQRAVLLVSDGVGGLRLTHGGSTPGPAALTVPGIVQSAKFHDSEHGRFSDIFVKGQTDSHRIHSGIAAPLDDSSSPLGPGAPDVPATATATAASIVLMTGHARDPEITRWRPDVRLTRSQSGMSTTQEQAEWAVRVARGLGTRITRRVLGFRAGKANALWRPNQVVTVTDPFADIDKPMLIAGVRRSMDMRGQMTELRVVGITAYDRINEAQRRRHRATPAAKPLDSTAQPLGA